MSLPPQKFREIVFLLLYGNDFFCSEWEETILLIMDNLKVTKKSVLEAKEKVMLILGCLGQIDEKISKASTEYSFERISSVEKTILRLGLYEILYDSTLDPKISFVEAIRLTRKFGSPESAHFVNAVLDTVYRDGLKFSEEPVSL